MVLTSHHRLTKEVPIEAGSTIYHKQQEKSMEKKVTLYLKFYKIPYTSARFRVYDSDKPTKRTTTVTDNAGKVLTTKTEVVPPEQLFHFCADAAKQFGQFKHNQIARLDITLTDVTPKKDKVVNVK